MNTIIYKVDTTGKYEVYKIFSSYTAAENELLVIAEDYKQRGWRVTVDKNIFKFRRGKPCSVLCYIGDYVQSCTGVEYHITTQRMAKYLKLFQFRNY